MGNLDPRPLSNPKSPKANEGREERSAEKKPETFGEKKEVVRRISPKGRVKTLGLLNSSRRPSGGPNDERGGDTAASFEKKLLTWQTKKFVVQTATVFQIVAGGGKKKELHRNRKGGGEGLPKAVAPGQKGRGETGCVGGTKKDGPTI